MVRVVHRGEGSSLDDTDRSILRLVQADARISNAELARRVGIPESTAHDRLSRLEEDGWIERYTAVLDHDALGLGVTAFTLVSLKNYAATDRVQASLVEIPEVLEVHLVSGDGDFLIKIRAEDPEHLQELLQNHVEPLPAVSDLRTRVALQTPKERTRAPSRALE